MELPFLDLLRLLEGLFSCFIIENSVRSDCLLKMTGFRLYKEGNVRFLSNESTNTTEYVVARLGRLGYRLVWEY